MEIYQNFITDQNNKDVPHPSYKINGIKCTSFKDEHVISRLKKKPLLGTINPIHIYEDPRQQKEQINLEPEVIPKKLWKENRSDKPLLEEHLTNPYIYIKNLKVYRNKVSQGQQSIQHPSNWNTSNNLASHKRQEQIPKPVMTDLTQSCNPAILEMSLQEKDIKKQREIIYQSNQKIKQDIYDFYSQIKDCLNQNNKKFSFAKWFDIYQRKKGYRFQVFKVKKTEKQGKQFDEKVQEILSQNTQKIYNNKSENFIKDPETEERLRDPRDIEQQKLNDKMEISKHDFIEFILNLGYPQKKIWEIERYYNYCLDGDHIEWGEKQHMQGDEEDQNQLSISNLQKSQNTVNSQIMGNTSSVFKQGKNQFQAVRKNPKTQNFSMRNCIYNFKRYLEDTSRVKFILSERSAHERCVSYKKAIEIFFENYPQKKQKLNELRDKEDSVLVLLADILNDFNDPEINRLYKISQQKENQLKTATRLTKDEKDTLQQELNENNALLEREMELYQQKYAHVRQRLEKLIQKRDSIFFNRRILLQNIQPLVKNHLESLPNPEQLRQVVINYYNQMEENEQIMDHFLDEFLKEKKTFKEDNFKLFEIGTFIYDLAYPKKDTDLITKLIAKVKGNFNLSEGNQKYEYVNPNTLIPLDILTKTFQIQKDQSQQALNYLANLYDEINDDVQNKKQELRDQVNSIKTYDRVYQPPEYRNPEIQKIMEKNAVLVFLDRIWQKMNKEYDNLYQKIQEIVDFILQNQLEDYLFLQLNQKMNEVLQEDDEPKIFKNVIKNTQNLLQFSQKNQKQSKINQSENENISNQKLQQFDTSILENQSQTKKSGVKFAAFNKPNNRDDPNFQNEKDIQNFLNENSKYANSIYK